MKKLLACTALLAGCLAVLQACQSINDPPVYCTLELRFSLRVIVTDSVTSEPITGDGVVVTAIDRDFTATSGVDPSGHARLGEERAGTYRVEVKAPGHRTWTRDNVKVTADECHVQPVDVHARMQPE